MKNKIDNLYRQIRCIMKNCDNGIQGGYDRNDVQQITNTIIDIAYSEKDSDEYIYQELMRIKDNLFFGANFVNMFQLGEIKVLLEILKKKYENKVLPNEILLDGLHPDIKRVSKDKYIDGYYADAVESAFKEINTRVKMIFSQKNSGEKIPDGADLMNRVFSPNNPIIELDDLTNESGVNIQKGYMQMFAGAMTGIRNPKAHANITITKEEALNSLFFASLLMEKIDKAKK